MNLKKKSPFTHVLLVGKNHTFWPQTVLELLAILHEKIKTNIHFISVNAFKKLFYSSFEFENFVESLPSQ